MRLPTLQLTQCFICNKVLFKGRGYALPFIKKSKPMNAIFYNGGKHRLSVCFKKANGSLVTITFDPPVLNGIVGRATYSTSDEELISLIKNSRHFNSTIFLLSEWEEAVPTETEDRENTAKDYTALCTDAENIIEEPSVVDVATAQNWLQSTHSAVFTARKAETIKIEAAKKYNTIFPNWN